MSDPRLPISKIDQVCVVARDLRRAMEQYRLKLGLEPWRIYTFGAPRVKDMTYRGQPADFSMRVAFAQFGAIQFELIQPLTGPTIYDELLERSGEGIHHFGVWVPNLDRAVSEARTAGFEVIQSGRGYGVHGDGGFAYLDTDRALGAIYELIEVPAERYPPDEVYPA